MTSWLEPLRRILADSTRTVQVFFRDDDAGWDDDGLGRLLDVFERQDTPIDVAAIPCATSQTLAGELVRRRAAGVHVHQHGYRHANHETAGRSCEFGPRRSRSLRRQDVARGQARLADLLGDMVDPVFTPPWNRCEPDVAEACLELGIGVLSRDSTATRLGASAIVEVPVTVDWLGATKINHPGSTRRLRWTSAELGARLAAGAAGADPLGVMLHHAAMSTDDLHALEELLSLLAPHPRVERTTIMGVVARCPT